MTREADTTAQRRVILAALMVTSAAALIAEGVVNVNLMPYAAGLGVPATGLGLVFTAHRLIRIVAAPWVGLATDRFGRRPPLLIGLLCVSLAVGALAFTPSFLPLLGARVLYGLASSLIVTAGLASVLDITRPEERGGALGLYQAALYGVYPLGSVVGGFAVDVLGYRPTFLVSGGVVLGSALLAVFTVRETRPAGPGRASAAAVPRVRDYPRLLNRRVRCYIALKMLSGFAIWGVFEATFVLFLFAVFGRETTLFGARLGTRSVAGLMLGAILLLGFLVGSPVVGRWSDRSGQRVPPIIASLALTALALLGLAVAMRTETVGAAVVVLGVAVALASAPLAALVGSAAPPEARAAVMGAYSSLSDVANSAGSILGVAIALSVGYRQTYVGTTVVVVGVGLLLLGQREVRERLA